MPKLFSLRFPFLVILFLGGVLRRLFFFHAGALVFFLDARVEPVAVVAVAAVGFAGHMIAHHVGGFYARIEEEDERARMEEEQAAKNAAQEENHQKGETQ